MKSMFYWTFENCHYPSCVKTAFSGVVSVTIFTLSACLQIDVSTMNPFCSDIGDLLHLRIYIYIIYIIYNTALKSDSNRVVLPRLQQ